MRGWLHKHGRLGRAFGVATVLLRVVTVLVAMQFSGALHDVSDFVAAVAELEHVDDGCPADRPCDDCPAGCPNCHCSNLAGSLVAPAGFAELREPLAESLLPRPLVGRTVPCGPDLPSIYRPPRPLTRS